LALDFLVQLKPRKSKGSDKFKVFSTFGQGSYLDAQQKLEEKALAIRYCTPRFTNVFDGDDYILDAFTKFVCTVYDKLNKLGDDKIIICSENINLYGKFIKG